MNFDFHFRRNANRARDEILLVREAGQFGIDQAGVDLLLQNRVVARELLDLAVAEAICA
jgi:hypothetical protein